MCIQNVCTFFPRDQNVQTQALQRSISVSPKMYASKMCEHEHRLKSKLFKQQLCVESQDVCAQILLRVQNVRTKDLLLVQNVESKVLILQPKCVNTSLVSHLTCVCKLKDLKIAIFWKFRAR